MDIKTDIEKQLHAGFSKDDIYQNLQAKGFSKQDIDQHYTTVSNAPEMKDRYGKVSPGSIMLGILFLVVMVVRLARYQNSGNGFLLIGVFTALVLAVLFFTKRK